jgi:uncharacterized protein (TIGR02145 family)
MMKTTLTYRILLSAILFLIIPAMALHGQGIAVNEDGSAPDSAAILDISSSSKGVLFPRMLKYERDRIDNPPMGLVIFNVEDTVMEYFNGVTWKLFDGNDAPEWACGDTIIDAEGNKYPTTSISGQCWMAENMNIGTRINGGLTQSTTPGNFEKYCMFNVESNCDIYGGWYQWAQAVQYWSGQPTLPVQGICPDGWHIPSFSEWQTVYNFLTTTFGGTAAGALKEQGTVHWQSPNLGMGTNNVNGDLFGFTALPAGAQSAGGYYFHQYGFIWLANQTTSTAAQSILLKYNQAWLNSVDENGKAYGMSVRCIQD